MANSGWLPLPGEQEHLELVWTGPILTMPLPLAHHASSVDQPDEKPALFAGSQIISVKNGALQVSINWESSTHHPALPMVESSQQL